MGDLIFDNDFWKVFNDCMFHGYVLILYLFVLLYYFFHNHPKYVKWLQISYLIICFYSLPIFLFVILEVQNVFGIISLMPLIIFAGYLLVYKKIKNGVHIPITIIMGFLYLFAMYLALENSDTFIAISLKISYFMLSIILYVKYLILRKVKNSLILLKINLMFGVIGTASVLYYIFKLVMGKLLISNILVYYLFFLSITYILDYLIMKKEETRF